MGYPERSRPSVPSGAKQAAEKPLISSDIGGEFRPYAGIETPASLRREFFRKL